jgi:hypothetical protein
MGGGYAPTHTPERMVLWLARKRIKLHCVRTTLDMGYLPTQRAVIHAGIAQRSMPGLAPELRRGGHSSEKGLTKRHFVV